MHVSDFLRAKKGPERDDRIFGVVIGIVKDIVDPANLGRIRVSYPWRAEETKQHVGQNSEEADNVDSTWARLATLSAGKDRGSWFVPEIDDEVLLAFHQGDPQRPYVIGTLWNKTDAPPEKMDAGGKNHLRTIKTRSGHTIRFDDNTDDKKAKIEILSAAGHKLVLDDAEGKEKVTVETLGGHQLALDDEKGKGKVHVETKAGHKLTMNDAPGSESIELVDKTGSNSIAIDSVQNAITLKAGVKVAIQATQVEIKADATMSIQAGGPLTIKGAIVQIN